MEDDTLMEEENAADENVVGGNLSASKLRKMLSLVAVLNDVVMIWMVIMIGRDSV